MYVWVFFFFFAAVEPRILRIVVKHLILFWDGNFEENWKVQCSDTLNFYIQNSSISSFLYGLGDSQLRESLVTITHLSLSWYLCFVTSHTHCLKMGQRPWLLGKDPVWGIGRRRPARVGTNHIHGKSTSAHPIPQKSMKTHWASSMEAILWCFPKVWPEDIFEQTLLGCFQMTDGVKEALGLQKKKPVTPKPVWTSVDPAPAKPRHPCALSPCPGHTFIQGAALF